MWDLETDESRLNKRYHLEAYTHLHAQGRIQRVLRLGASWNLNKGTNVWNRARIKGRTWAFLSSDFHQQTLGISTGNEG